MVVYLQINQVNQCMSFQKLQDYFYSFSPLTESEWEAQVQYLSIKQIKKGDFIVREEQICTHMNFINKGTQRNMALKDHKQDAEVII